MEKTLQLLTCWKNYSQTVVKVEIKYYKIVVSVASMLEVVQAPVTQLLNWRQVSHKIHVCYLRAGGTTATQLLK